MRDFNSLIFFIYYSLGFSIITVKRVHWLEWIDFEEKNYLIQSLEFFFPGLRIRLVFFIIIITYGLD